MREVRLGLVSTLFSIEDDICELAFVSCDITSEHGLRRTAFPFNLLGCNCDSLDGSDISVHRFSIGESYH